MLQNASFLLYIIGRIVKKLDKEVCLVQNEEENGEKTFDNPEFQRASIKSQHDWRLLFSLLAALTGAILGLIPATLCAYLFKATFYPFFIAAPLLTYLFNRLFRGSCDIRTIVITAGFSLVSAYVTALACYVTLIVHQVSLVVPTFKMSIGRIPGLTIEALTQPNNLPESFSAFVYPLVFTALGIIIVWELLCGSALSGKFRIDTKE